MQGQRATPSKIQILVSALVGSYVMMAAGVLLASFGLFSVALLVSYGIDFMLPHIPGETLTVLRRSRFGLTIRFLLREMLLLGFLAYAAAADTVVVGMVVGALLLLILTQMLYALAMQYIVGLHRALPVSVRALDLAEFIPPPLPPDLLYRRYVRKMLYLDTPAVGGTLASIATSATAPGVVGAVLTAGSGLVAVCAVVPYFLRARQLPTREELLFAVNRAIDLHRPAVAIYFSFASVSKDFMYQVNMWLESMEALDQPSVIILRERSAMELLMPTSVPVVCVPKADDLAEIAFPHLRVVMYSGNAGKNVHMLQRAEMRHVFIGHGDSDKLASSNRVSKIYDEIWVAGRAGRERYARVRNAIRGEDIVEVGRPQLAPVQAWSEQPVAEPTVLYAPTWEGWSDSGNYTSAMVMGEELIRTLLRENPGGRIIYRPHPLLGHRLPQAAAAHRAVLNLLDQDNARRRSKGHSLMPDPEALRRMRQLQARIDILLDRSRSSPAYRLTEQERVVRLRASQDQWHRLYQQAYSDRTHFVSTGSLPGLVECFNAADVMISDISSVVSDFLASGKPYALTNPQQSPQGEYLAQNSVASAAYLLAPDLMELPAVLTAVRSPAQDVLRPRREQLRTFLLGEDHQNSLQQFRRATSDLLQRALTDFPPGMLAEPIIASPLRTAPHSPTIVDKESEVRVHDC